jgi:hypothetical protein
MQLRRGRACVDLRSKERTGSEVGKILRALEKERLYDGQFNRLCYQHAFSSSLCVVPSRVRSAGREFTLMRFLRSTCLWRSLLQLRCLIMHTVL